MKQSMAIMAVVMVLLVTCGCREEACLEIENKTGQEITVRSGHSGTTEHIGIYKRGTVPHALGSVDIVTKNGKKWHYKMVDVSGSEVLVTKTLYGSDLKMRVLVNPDGEIYLLPKRPNASSNLKAMQPTGYPLKPDGAATH